MKSWFVDETWFFIKKASAFCGNFCFLELKNKFPKPKTYLFAYIALETHGDNMFVVLFVLVGCALQEKMQLPSEPQYGIIMVHHLTEITVKIQKSCLDNISCSCITRPAWCTEHCDSVLETTSLHFSWFWF